MQVTDNLKRTLISSLRISFGLPVLIATLVLTAGQRPSLAGESAPKNKAAVETSPKTDVADDKDIKDSDGKSLNLSTSPKKYAYQEVDLSYSYVGEAQLSGKNRGNNGDLGEQSTAFSYNAKFPITDQLSIVRSLDYNRFDFSRPDGSFLPQNLQQFSLNFGLSYALTEKWALFGRFGTTLSLINGFDIYSDNIYFNGILGANYIFDKNLSVQFGLVVAPDNGLEIPVLPFGSAQWRFAENWKLNFGLPKTSVDWDIQPNLRWSLVEGQYAGGTFQTNGDYGTKVGVPQLNDRRLNYREVRVGTRISYSPVRDLNIDLAVGAAVYRNFDFEDVGNASPTVDPAPYVQLGAKFAF